MTWQDFELNEDELLLRDSIFRFELEDNGIEFIENYQSIITWFPLHSYWYASSSDRS